MTRKEMIEEIAIQADCSKRLVRKRLFQFSAHMRKNKHTLFTKAFLNRSTDWLDWEEIHAKWKQDKTEKNPFRTSNTFEVADFPSGIVVLFRVDESDNDGYIFEGFGTCGCRLYSHKKWDR